MEGFAEIWRLLGGVGLLADLGLRCFKSNLFLDVHRKHKLGKQIQLLKLEITCSNRKTIYIYICIYTCIFCDKSAHSFIPLSVSNFKSVERGSSVSQGFFPHWPTKNDTHIWIRVARS